MWFITMMRQATHGFCWEQADKGISQEQTEDSPIYQLGFNPPADIASGRIAEVRRRSMSCNCMTRTSQQECRGILEHCI